MKDFSLILYQFDTVMRRSLIFLLLFPIIFSSSLECDLWVEIWQTSFGRLLRRIPNDDLLLVATPDGTMHLVDPVPWKVYWSFASGERIYSSYQALSESEENDTLNTSGPKSDLYLDYGDDMQLYVCSRRRGKLKKLELSPDEYVRRTPYVAEDGGITLASKKTTMFRLDAISGKSVTRAQDAGALADSGLGNSAAVQLLIYISRKDYVLQYCAPKSSEVLWKVTFSEIDAEFQCQGSENKLSEDDMHKFDLTLPRQKKPKPIVIRFHDHELLESFCLPIYRWVPPLPLADILPQARSDDGAWPENSLRSEDTNVLNTTRSFHMAGSSIRFINSIFAILLTVIGLASYPLKQGKGSKQDLELKEQAVNKKKKPKRSGENKNNATNDKRNKLASEENEVGNFNRISYIEGNEGKPVLSSTNLVDGHGDERRIGKLLVSSKEIAKGSNGTVVLEGIYDGRPVAVKRIVRSHHDVARKEIEILIASDQHPNIVRWHGVEFDQGFVYLSLERCTCSLNDLIYNKDIELWKPNGHPSTHLLKLMSDIVSGLAHLHELGITHRDLKPQNVLIIKERSLCAKLSDMCISKRLTGDMSSLTRNATGCETSGWQAQAENLFSLGCVLFFCVSGGKQPYGDNIERDENIKNDQKDYFLIDGIPEAVDLISQLLDPNPEMRPNARNVLRHPFFRDPGKRLSFLVAASDFFEFKDKSDESDLLNALQSIASVVLKGKWDKKMKKKFINYICQPRKYRKYEFDSVRDLLRLIRNKKCHYVELPQEFQKLLGSVPEGYYEYFSGRFPKLLIEVYKFVCRHCKEDNIFKKYI